MEYVRDSKPYKWFSDITKEGKYAKAANLAGFYRDDKNIHHAKQNWSVQIISVIG